MTNSKPKVIEIGSAFSEDEVHHRTGNQKTRKQKRPSPSKTGKTGNKRRRTRTRSRTRK